MKGLGASNKILIEKICVDKSTKGYGSLRKPMLKVVRVIWRKFFEGFEYFICENIKLALYQFSKKCVEVEYILTRVLGCLMFNMVCTRIYLAQVVCYICKFISKSSKRYWEIFKRIFKYLKGTTCHGIMFNSGQSDL